MARKLSSPLRKMSGIVKLLASRKSYIGAKRGQLMKDAGKIYRGEASMPSSRSQSKSHSKSHSKRHSKSHSKSPSRRH